MKPFPWYLVKYYWQYVKRILVGAYIIFSTLASVYLMLELGRREANHLISAAIMLNYEERMLQVERLWGVAPCQGNTVDYNP